MNLWYTDFNKLRQGEFGMDPNAFLRLGELIDKIEFEIVYFLYKKYNV